jgi:hypothetical protein
VAFYSECRRARQTKTEGSAGVSWQSGIHGKMKEIEGPAEASGEAHFWAMPGPVSSELKKSVDIERKSSVVCGTMRCSVVSLSA